MTTPGGCPNREKRDTAFDDVCLVDYVLVCYTQVNPIREEDDEDIIIPWQTSSSTATNSGASSVKPKAPVVEIEVQKQQTAIDITADDLIPRMTPQNVTDLVLLSMVRSSLLW